MPPRLREMLAPHEPGVAVQRIEFHCLAEAAQGGLSPADTRFGLREVEVGVGVGYGPLAITPRARSGFPFLLVKLDQSSKGVDRRFRSARVEI